MIHTASSQRMMTTTIDETVTPRGVLFLIVLVNHFFIDLIRFTRMYVHLSPKSTRSIKAPPPLRHALETPKNYSPCHQLPALYWFVYSFFSLSFSLVSTQPVRVPHPCTARRPPRRSAHHLTVLRALPSRSLCPPRHCNATHGPAPHFVASSASCVAPSAGRKTMN